MSQEIKVTGMVLQAGNIGEYDKRIVLLTKERGRISAFARGAKKATSQYAAVCQPFTFGEFSLYDRIYTNIIGFNLLLTTKFHS